MDESICLVMDNAGGHGSNDAKALYTRSLRTFGVEIVWQVPRSPETNLLDLGIWMSIQATVQNLHHQKRIQHDALANTVEVAWEGNLNPVAFSNV